MPEEPKNGRPIDGEIPANAIATEMLRNIVLLNEGIRESHKLQAQILESLQDLADYHETYMRASEMLVEQVDEGKNKISLADFVKALSDAADEVLGSEEDEPGNEDPLVESRR